MTDCAKSHRVLPTLAPKFSRANGAGQRSKGIGRMAKRDQQRRNANKRFTPKGTSRMEQMRANAENAKGAVPQAMIDGTGIPAGPFRTPNGEMFPPFIPSQVTLVRLDFGSAQLFGLRMETMYGGAMYYLPREHFEKFVEQCTNELAAARTGLVVANEQTMHQVAEQAKQMASGLVVPPSR